MFISLTFWYSAKFEKENVYEKIKKKMIICENLPFSYLEKLRIENIKTHRKWKTCVKQGDW